MIAANKYIHISQNEIIRYSFAMEVKKKKVIIRIYLSRVLFIFPPHKNKIKNYFLILFFIVK